MISQSNAESKYRPMADLIFDLIWEKSLINN